MTAEDPGSSVSRAGQQPAGARLGDGDRLARADAAARRPARRPSCRRRRRACRRGARARTRRTARRRAASPRLVARDDLDLAAAQARRDLERARARSPPSAAARSVAAISDSGHPEQAQHRAAVLDRAARARRRTLGRLAAPPATSAAARAAGRAARRPSGPSPVGRRHDEPRRGPDRLEDRARPPGSTACLRLDAQHRLGIEVRPARHERLEDLRDAPFQRLVEHHLAALEARRRPRR